MEIDSRRGGSTFELSQPEALRLASTSSCGAVRTRRGPSRLGPASVPIPAGRLPICPRSMKCLDEVNPSL